jgi:hypothetical protein
MDSNAPGTLFEHFSPLEDGRDPTKVRHLLIEIVIIAIVAVICGADGWTEIEEFGKSNEEWFRKFLKLENGIPAHDTFGRVFSLIAPNYSSTSCRDRGQSIHQAFGILAELDAIALGCNPPPARDEAICRC